MESPRSSQRGRTVCSRAVDETEELELEAGRNGEDRLPGSLAWSVGFQAESGWHLVLVADTKSPGEGGRNLHRKSAESPGNGGGRGRGGPSRCTATGLEDRKVREDSLPLVLHYLTVFVLVWFLGFFW